MIDEAQKSLAKAVAACAHDGLRVSSKLLAGVPWHAVVDLLEADPTFDLVVIGTNGRSGVSRMLLGSVAEQVVRHAPCSVLAIHAGDSVDPFVNVLCPTDFSESAATALELATTLARPGGAGISLVHVLDLSFIGAAEPTMSSFVADLDTYASAELTKLVDKTRGATSVPVTGRTRVGGPARQILAMLTAEPGIDLVVLGSHGRTGLRRLLLGSVAEQIVRHAHCPVLVARKRRVAAP
jgi:nucleotide-binding universal stress UspA family protein